MFYNIEPTLDWKTLKLLHLGRLKHYILNYDLNKFNNIEPTLEWSNLKVLHLVRHWSYICKLLP